LKPEKNTEQTVTRPWFLLSPVEDVFDSRHSLREVEETSVHEEHREMNALE